MNFLTNFRDYFKTFYYRLRNKFNKVKNFNSLQYATLFYFLNRTCFGGIYRENKKGEFNVPYGNFKTIKLISKNDFFEISYLIQKVIFKQQSSKAFFENVVFNKNDFLYLDPPYFPLNKNSFTNYLFFGLNLLEHQYMFNWILSFKKESRFLLYNSFTKYLLEIFSSKNYVKHTIYLSNNLKLKKNLLKELMIVNYN